MTGWAQGLPVDVLVRIAAEVDVAQRYTLAAVCSRWRQELFVAEDLWRKLDFTASGQHIQNTDILQVLRNRCDSSKVKELRLNRCVQLQPLFVSGLLHYCGNGLRVLSLQREIPDELVGISPVQSFDLVLDLSSIFENCPLLRDLAISGYRITITKTAVTASHLKLLDIRNTGGSFLHYWDIFGCVGHLECLKVSSFSESAGLELLALLNTSDSLSELWLQGCRLPSSQLLAVLQSLTKLRILRLISMRVPRFHRTLQLLGRHPRLEHLSIDSSRLPYNMNAPLSEEDLLPLFKSMTLRTLLINPSPWESDRRAFCEGLFRRCPSLSQITVGTERVLRIEI